MVERRGRYQLGSVNLRVQDVLNDNFDKPFPMSRAAIPKGSILAYGCEPIPGEIRRGIVPVEVRLVDTLGREAGEVERRADRGWAHCPAVQGEDDVAGAAVSAVIAASRTTLGT